MLSCGAFAVDPVELCWCEQEVAGQVRNHPDADGAVSRRDSFKVAQVIHHRLAQGGSSQGFGPDPNSAISPAALDCMPAEPHPSQVGLHTHASWSSWQALAFQPPKSLHPPPHPVLG